MQVESQWLQNERDGSAYSIDGIEKNDRYVNFLSESKEQKVLFYLQEWGGLVRV